MENQKATSVYAELTPNPATMKFVANRMIVNGNYMAEYMHAADVKGSAPLADQLFTLPFVKSLFFAGNFVSVTKIEDMSWDYITMELREFIQDFLRENEWAVTSEPQMKNAEKGDEDHKPSENATHSEPRADIDMRIIELLDEYVKPAVERDGGAILFRSFDQGKVTLAMRGACAGCPSSTMTLKSGIETLLKQHLQEVEEVIAETV